MDDKEILILQGELKEMKKHLNEVYVRLARVTAKVNSEKRKMSAAKRRQK